MKFFFIILIAVLLLTPGLASAYLSQDDEIALTRNLEVLSGGGSDVAAFSATTIFGNPNYSAGNWETYFNKFFVCSPTCAPNSLVEHSFTTPLYNYIAKTVIPDSPADKNDLLSNLQAGLINPLWAKIRNITSTHPTDLGMTIFNNATLRQSIFNVHRLFTLLGEKGVLDLTSRTNVYFNYKIYIKTYPQYFSDGTTIDNFVQPFVSLLRAQVWAGFVQILQLDTARKGEIAATIGLGGINQKKLDIWNSFMVLVIDNNALGSAQLNMIYDILNGIPAGLHNLRYVTVRDHLSWPPSSKVILDKGNSTNYDLTISPDNFVKYSFRDSGGKVEEFTGKTALEPDAWNHVAVTSDGNTVTIYLNGEQDGTYNTSGLPNTGSSEPLLLGKRLNQTQWMRGKLDEVKIYGRALSASEISDEYKNQSLSTAKLVAYYRMDEPRGEFVADFPGLGNNGSNVGATIVPGKVSNGLFFNGKNSYVEVPDSPTLRLVREATLESWVFIVNEDEGLAFGRSGAVNITGMKIGDYSENQFPVDISAGITDGFSITAVHEFNHVVDNFLVNGDANLNHRRDQLIKQASSYQNDLQFLRMSGSKFFSDNPQEFFASISNQYFTDTWHTFDLAIQRFEKGYKEPINQFLFFANIYSKNGLTTKVYALNTKGILTVNNAPIYRDLFGNITEITRRSRNIVYRFILDFNGNVLYYSKEPATKS
jgi:hypothetical protein